MLDKIDGIVFLWDWNPKAKQIHDDFWILKEHYPIDDSGYPLVDNATSIEKFTLSKIVSKEDEDDVDFDEINGKCVTLWTFLSGVQLYHFSPPKYAKWLEVGFIEKIKKLPDWSSYLASGYKLRLNSETNAKILIANYFKTPAKETKDE